MTALSADQIAQNWANALAGASQKIAAGVNAVKVAPGQAAARQQAAYVQGVTANANKWAQRVSSVPLSAWQQATIEKGASRIGPGATAAIPKFTAFMTKLLPFQANLVNNLPPRGNTAQNISRAVAFMQGMSGFSNS